jgi:peroxiredoxin
MTDISNEFPQQEKTPTHLAIASFTLGIISIALSLFIVGGILAIIGLILGIFHLKQHTASRAMAKWGVGLSVIALVASIGAGYMNYRAYNTIKNSIAGGGEENNEEFDEWQGVQAPDFNVTTLDGRQIHLSDLRGKRVVVDMWATWCPPCQMELPHFIRLVKESDANNLIVIGISNEAKDVLSKFAKQKGINYSIASSDDLLSPYKDVESIPTTFFIDRKGVIQTVFQGYHDYEALKSAALAEDFTGVVKSK